MKHRLFKDSRRPRPAAPLLVSAYLRTYQTLALRRQLTDTYHIVASMRNIYIYIILYYIYIYINVYVCIYAPSIWLRRCGQCCLQGCRSRTLTVEKRQHTSAFNLPACCSRRLKRRRKTSKAHRLGDMNDLSDDGHLRALAASDSLVNSSSMSYN